MTIKSIQAIPVSVPFEIWGPKPTLAGKPRGMEMLLIRVENDQGLVGWGEAFGFAVVATTKTAIDTLIAPLVIGRDEADINGIHTDLSKKFHLLGRSGPVMYAVSGLDIALWDLAGKAAGKSLSALLGGARRKEVRAYASLMRYTDPELVALNSARAVAEGFDTIKLHEITRPPILRAREAIGPAVKLMVDTNCPWSVEESLAMCQQLKALDLYWLEEPVWPPEDYLGLAQVRRLGGIPTAAGENASSYLDFKAMFTAGAVDYAQPSVTKIGGVTEMLRIAQLARDHGVTLAPHSPYVGPGLLATIHLLAVLEEDIQLEYCFCEMDDNPMGTSVRATQARLAVPTGHGLGCDPDMQLVEKHTVR
jgi:D-galactarolactone cycloisomerase